MGSTARVSWAGTACAAAVLAGLALGGCASSGGADGTIRGQALLYGNVPLPGHPVDIGAISGGKVVTTVQIPRSGGPFEFSVPAGNYQVALLISGLPRSVTGTGCFTNVQLAAGQTATASIECEWHG